MADHGAPEPGTSRDHNAPRARSVSNRAREAQPDPGHDVPGHGRPRIPGREYTGSGDLIDLTVHPDEPWCADAPVVTITDDGASLTIERVRPTDAELDAVPRAAAGTRIVIFTNALGHIDALTQGHRVQFDPRHNHRIKAAQASRFSGCASAST